MNEKIKKLIRARVYFSRGMSWLSDLSRFSMFAIFFKVFDFFPDSITLFISGVLALLIALAGRYDIKKIKSMQYEAEFTTSLNPTVQGIVDGMKKMIRKKKGIAKTERLIGFFIPVAFGMFFLIPAVIAILPVFSNSKAWPLLFFGIPMLLPAGFFISLGIICQFKRFDHLKFGEKKCRQHPHPFAVAAELPDEKKFRVRTLQKPKGRIPKTATRFWEEKKRV